MGYNRRLQWFIAAALAAGFVESYNLTYVELFAGDRAWSRGMVLLGFEGRSWDARYNKSMDLLTPTGFMLVVMSVLSMHVGAVLLAAPPCSSWIFMSRFSTGRWARILGDPCCASIRAQNALVGRLVYILVLCIKRGVNWSNT